MLTENYLKKYFFQLTSQDLEIIPHLEYLLDSVVCTILGSSQINVINFLAQKF